MKPLRLGFLLFAATLVLACTPRTDPDEGAPEPQVEPSAAPGASGPAPAPAPAPTTAPTTSPVVRVFDESLLRGREFLLELRVPHPVPVRDSDLGPLGTDAALTEVVKKFLASAATGSVDQESLSPRWAAYLQAWAKRFQQQNWRGYAVRVGEAVSSDDEVVVPLRLRTKEKAASGWAALVRDGTRYLVSDIQLSEVELRTTPFDPESPPQEISSPSRR